MASKKNMQKKQNDLIARVFEMMEDFEGRLSALERRLQGNILPNNRLDDDDLDDDDPLLDDPSGGIPSPRKPIMPPDHGGGGVIRMFEHLADRIDRIVDSQNNMQSDINRLARLIAQLSPFSVSFYDSGGKEFLYEKMLTPSPSDERLARLKEKREQRKARRAKA